MNYREDTCLICNEQNITKSNEYSELKRVTSDSKIWLSEGQIGQCLQCSAIQKIYREPLISEIEIIYKNYELYFQGKGQEQKIFINNKPQPRSEIILNYFLKMLSTDSLKINKKWLDFGCGTGHLLQRLSNLDNYFYLYGADLSEKNREHIESIHGVKKYYSNGLSSLDITFDIIYLLHVLEHIPNPIEFLQILSNNLSRNGYILIAVPNWYQNPFDLLIADHIHHYTTIQLIDIFNKAGFSVLCMTDVLIPKELIFIIKKTVIMNNENYIKLKETDITISGEKLQKTILWLKSLTHWATPNATSTIGVFGTALAATWLAASNSSSFSFFVDEDQDRVNTMYLGRPVYSPDNVQDAARILVPLPNQIADQICSRLNQQGKGKYYSPPTL